MPEREIQGNIGHRECADIVPLQAVSVLQRAHQREQ